MIRLDDGESNVFAMACPATNDYLASSLFHVWPSRWEVVAFMILGGYLTYRIVYELHPLLAHEALIGDLDSSVQRLRI